MRRPLHLPPLTCGYLLLRDRGAPPMGQITNVKRCGGVIYPSLGDQHCTPNHERCANRAIYRQLQSRWHAQWPPGGGGSRDLDEVEVGASTLMRSGPSYQLEPMPSAIERKDLPCEALPIVACAQIFGANTTRVSYHFQTSPAPSGVSLPPMLTHLPTGSFAKPSGNPRLTGRVRDAMYPCGAPPSAKVTNVKRSRLDLCLHLVRRPLPCNGQHANLLRRNHFARSGAESEPP